eukprot:GILI01006020.1.p1 GENE.GILI01006020.1~~GILI01006020.1.p1  ORF type:complete len:472 (+),score=54.64 GILI01006020.1:49-1464(+)
MQPEDHSIDWGLPQTGDTDHEINHTPLPEFRMLHLRQRSNLLLSRLDSYVLATVRTRHIVTNTVSKSFVETSNGTVEEVIQERRHVRTVREVFPDEDDEEEAKHITSYKGNAPVERHTSPANDSESAPEAVHTAPMRTPPLAPRQVVVGNTSQPEPTSDYYPKLDRVEEAAEDDIYSKLSPLSPTPSPITKRTPCGIKSKQSASSGSPLPPGAVLCSRCLSHNQPPSTADAASFVYVRSRSPSARSMSGDPQVEALPKVVATSTVSSVAKCSPRGLAKMIPPPTTVGIDSRGSARSHSIDSSSPEAFVVVGNESHLTSVHTDPNTWLSGPTPNATAPIAKRAVRAAGLSPPTDEERRRSAIAAKKLRADREELNKAPDAFVFIEEPSSSTQEPRAPAKPAVYSRCVSRDNNSRAPSPRPSLSAPCPTPQPGDFKDPLISTAYFRNHVAISAPTSTEIERYKAASSTVRKGA